MIFVRIKPNVTWPNTNLRDCWGSGTVIGPDWVGIVYIEVPFDPQKLEKTETNLDPIGGQVPIRVTVDKKVTVKEGPQCPGGHLVVRPDGTEIVNLWWRCVLTAGQFQPA